MKKDHELIVITKTYDLILWSCNTPANSRVTTVSCQASRSSETSTGCAKR